MNLLDKVYLPQLEKDQIRNSESYKLLKDNNLDPTVLEGYESNYKDANIQIKDFDTFINEGGTKEDWIAQHVTPENKKAFFGTIGDFIVETGKDTLLSLGVAGINGADVAVNMMPLVAKVLDNSPLATALPNGFMNAETEADVYNAAKYASENLDKARDYLKSFKEDDNVVSQLIGIMGQDFVYSIPIYNKLKSLGVPNYPAFFIAGGVGGAIGVEEKVLGDDSYFSKNLFAKDITELKNLIGILPNTPEDKIADEVVQALEYGSFSVAIPGIIDAFKFMKRYIPAFSATAGAGVGMTADNEAEGSPIKAIVNAVNKVPVFKSAVKETVEQKITKGSGNQIYNTIKNTPGVKESELKWIGLESFLKDKKNVSQEEILNFIEANRIDVGEKRFGAAERQADQPKDLKDFTDDEYIKLENKIFEDIEAGRARDEYRYVIDHISYLRRANFQRLDNFGIRKTEYAEGFDAPDITDQNYNMSNYMGDNYLWRAVDGLDDDGGGAIGYDYWENTFADFYEVFAIKSKSTKQLLNDELEGQLYKKFAEEQMNIPDEMIRNADVNNGFHIQGDAFEDFKKYLDDNGAYIQSYQKMEIPKDQREAVFNETLIRSNEEMYYQNSGDLDSISEALDEYVGSGLNRTQYEQYTAPGGEAYSELVFTLREGGENVGNRVPIETPITTKAKLSEMPTGIRLSPHFNVSGEIAHVRFKSRMNGNMKILSVEEMQSDLVQGVKQFNDAAIDNKRQELIQAEGTRQIERNVFENMSEEDIQNSLTLNPPDDLIKDFPFKNNWYELVLKRLIRYAADNGFDAISIPKAKIIQDRYNLTRRINDLEITAYFPERQEIGIMGRDQDGITEYDDLYSFEKLKKEFGEDTQKKILEAASKFNDTDDYLKIPLDKAIEIGGQGKARLYNKTIPSFLKKYGKKWNAKVYDDKIGMTRKDVAKSLANFPNETKIEGIPVTIIEITPEMKQSVQSTSQPLFEIFGTVGLSTWGAKAVQDSIENNIISQNTN